MPNLMMDREKAEVYALMGNFIAKMVLVVANVLLLFGITGFMIWHALHNPTWQTQTIFAALDGILAHTSYQMMKHFFPTSGGGTAKAKPKKPKALPDQSDKEPKS
jgi:hypothetical protein